MLKSFFYKIYLPIPFCRVRGEDKKVMPNTGKLCRYKVDSIRLYFYLENSLIRLIAFLTKKIKNIKI